MEELRDAALAYYNNYSEDTKRRAWSEFSSMDTDHVHAVSFHMLIDYFSQQCRGEAMALVLRNLLYELDGNGDRRLDFSEFLTLYYIVKTRDLWCNSCGACLRGLYFTCHICFDGNGDTFDLCPICYKNRHFRHEHAVGFVDSYMLLRQMRQTIRTQAVENLNLAVAPYPPQAIVPPVAPYPPDQAIVPAVAGPYPPQAIVPPVAPYPPQAIVPHVAPYPPDQAIVPAVAGPYPRPRPNHFWAALQALQALANVATILTTCSIM